MSLRTGADRALALIRTLPRVAINNLRPTNFFRIKERGRGQNHGLRHGCAHKGGKQRMRYGRLGYEGGRTPFMLKIPMEPYYKDHSLRRQYPPLSLGKLQLMIDTNRISTEWPIDLAAICNTNIYSIQPLSKHYGVHLTDEGIDTFSAQINIEVQWATEAVIAAIERNGGTITTSYYDMDSLFPLINPLQYFKKGFPIPKRMLPPEDAVEYYTDPKFRGYLADPDKIAEERLVLAQEYGYKLPDLSSSPKKEILLMRKDPRQIFYGLEPGWVVNLRDKCILKPKDPALLDYYKN